MANDSLKDFIRLATAQGWRVEQTAKQHWTFYPLDKSFSPITTSGTPSDFRAWKNCKSRLKRAGLQMGTFKGLLGGG